MNHDIRGMEIRAVKIILIHAVFEPYDRDSLTEFAFRTQRSCKLANGITRYGEYLPWLLQKVRSWFGISLIKINPPLSSTSYYIQTTL